MLNLLDDCIVSCENCVSECVKMKHMDCIDTCVVCERVCKALKVAIKFSDNKGMIHALKTACKKSCMDCIRECKKSDMKCCQVCYKKCVKLCNALSMPNRKKQTKKN